VGEAFTKDKKSSAAWREGLAAMVLRAHDSNSDVEVAAQRNRRAGVSCNRVARSG
jgi:hypothetical protein